MRKFESPVAIEGGRTPLTLKDAGGWIILLPEWAVRQAIHHGGEPARLLRNAKLYEIGAGTSEIRRMLIGRELFDKTA